MWRQILAVAGLWVAGVVARPAAGRTIYVDFDGGLDASSGLSAREAFKRAPGDAAAEGQAKGMALVSGDEVVFKGGVTYRGSVVVPASGEVGRPIVYDGNTAGKFGTGRAIVDGSETVLGWKVCGSAEECLGNPNWKKIFHVAVPWTVEPFASNMYGGEKMCWLAQEPNPKDPFYQDRPEGHRKVLEATANTITDTGFFTQKDADAFEGAWLVVYASPNYPYFVRITGYDPAAHRVTHSGKLINPSSYAVLNWMGALDTPGEYVVRPGKNGGSEIFLWPHDGAEFEKSGASVSRLGTGFVVSGREAVEIRGFTIEKFDADKYTAMGIEISKSNFITVLGNEVRFGNHSRTGGVQHGAGISVDNSQEVLVGKNRIVDNRRCSGIIVHPGKHVVVSDNTVSRTGYVGIWFMQVTESQIIGNTVTDNHGVHSNAISIYTNSDHILVGNNRVYRCERPLTLQDSPNLTVVNNVLIGDGGPALGLWGGKPIEKIAFLNNLILNTVDGEGIYAVNKVVRDCVFENNIMGNFLGEAAIDAKGNTFRNNIYLSARQPLYGASDKHTKASDLFVDPEKEDYHLKAGCAAVDGGAKPEYPEQMPPVMFDFGKDADGRPRQQGAAIDVGPYEHEGK